MLSMGIKIIIGLVGVMMIGIPLVAQQSEYTYSGKVSGDAAYPYLLHLPTTASLAENGQYPLIVFLHGAGERGRDFELLKKHGPPMLAARDAGFPFMVLSPQCPTDDRWDAYQLRALVDHLISTQPVDENRVYLTGLSMGGYGTFDLGQLAPDRFAALVPICGGHEIHAWMAHKIADIPTWVFHGALDEIVPVGNSSRIVGTLRALGAPVRYTVYPEAGHDSWTETYANPELYNWLLAQRREGR